MRAGDQSPVLAIALSDVHLSLKPPLARAEEASWFEAMRRALDEVSALAREHSAIVLCAGDIFDRWNSPAELINFALERLPKMYAIPGNHDLPSHRPDLVRRSAYWTLVEAGKVHHLTPEPLHVNCCELYGCTFGGPVPAVKKTTAISICLVHEYLWVPGSGYQGAPDEWRLKKQAKKFKGFNVVIVGDNHMGFLRELKSGTTVFNCGSVFRRKSNEAGYRPQVGIIRASGIVTPHYLDVSQDKLLVTAPVLEPAELDSEVVAFVEELAGLQGCSLNFKEAMREALDKQGASQTVRDLVDRAMEGAKP